MADKKRLLGTYQIQFIRCTCELSQRERELLIRRHKSLKQKAKRAAQTQERYATLEPATKRARLDDLAKQYTNMTPSDKSELRIQNSEKYKRMKEENPEQYNLMREKTALKYKSMHPDTKEKYVSKQRRLYKKRSSTSHSLDYYIEQFNRSRRDGPYYICVVCNRLLYRKSVIELKREKYNSNLLCLLTSVASINGNVFICYTCH